MRRSLFVMVVCVFGGIATAQNQAPATASLQYDVVSVKENHSAAYTSSLQFDRGDVLKAENANVMMMVCAAYDLPQYLVESLPSWALSEHFDVGAKILDASAEQIKALTTTQRRAMLAAVLQARFGLKTHWETRDKPEYDLVVAKSGSKLKASQEQQPTNAIRWNSLDAKGIRIGDLATDLQRPLGKPVLDRTGLTGKYDMKLTWSTEGQTLNGGAASADETHPGIFTAVKETLGLELKPTHGPVPVLVVDAVDHPSPN